MNNKLLLRKMLLFCLGVGGNPYGSYEEEYQSVIKKGESLGYKLPSKLQQIAGNNLIIRLKDAGLWDTLDLLYITWCDGSREFSTLNWKDPDNFQLEEIGTVYWTPNAGFVGDGVTGYLDTKWDMFSDAVNYIKGTSQVSINVTKAPLTSDGGSDFFGIEKGGDYTSIYSYGADAVRVQMNSSSIRQVAGVMVDPIGTLTIQKDNNQPTSNFHFFRRGVSISNLAFNNVNYSAPMGTLLIGANRDDGVPERFGDAEWCAFNLGGTIIGKESTMHDIIEMYKVEADTIVAIPTDIDYIKIF